MSLTWPQGLGRRNPNYENFSSQQSLEPRFKSAQAQLGEIQYKIKLNSINHRPKLHLYFRQRCAVEACKAWRQHEAILLNENLCCLRLSSAQFQLSLSIFCELLEVQCSLRGEALCPGGMAERRHFTEKGPFKHTPEPLT